MVPSTLSTSPAPPPCLAAHGLDNDLVRAQQVAAQLTQQLADVPLEQGEAATRQLSRCFSVTRLSAVEPPVFFVSVLGGISGNDGVVVYFTAGHWHSAALVTSTGSPPGGGEYSVATPLLATVASDGFDVLARGYIPSAGAGEARVELFHLGPQASLAWTSERRYGCTYRSSVLGDDLLLESWTEGTPGPATFADHVYVCATGWTRQVLWERKGSAFVQAATRVVPSAGWTLVYFIGALQNGDSALARSYATSAQLVDTVGAFARDPALKAPSDLFADELTEAAAWDALPPRDRGPMPAAQRDMDLGTHVLHLERTAGVWRVTRVVR